MVGSTTGTLGASSSGGADGFVRSYTKDGALQWTDQIGSSADDAVTAIGNNNPYTIAGTTSELGAAP